MSDDHHVAWNKRMLKNAKDFYYKYLRKYFKYIPIIGIILLIALSIGKNSDEINGLEKDDISIMNKLSAAYCNFINSFNFSDKIELAFSIILMITLWTGYKYWLVNIKYLRRNSKILERIVIVAIFTIFVVRHVLANSAIGKYVDWVLFLLYFYLTVSGTWFIAKTIDAIDLSSDLYCWGLRLLGAVIVFFGVILFMSSTLVLALADSKLVLDNISWIISICAILLGAFMGYRSFRRHPAIHVW